MQGDDAILRGVSPTAVSTPAVVSMSTPRAPMVLRRAVGSSNSSSSRSSGGRDGDMIEVMKWKLHG